MANETSKQMLRRCADRRFPTRWIVGAGIDIGCGPDPLSNLKDFFPLMTSLRPWDLEDGDAMLMAGLADDCFDFVHSSHCLEHLQDPELALRNWIRICKPAGHLLITVPDEDLYEQGVWPSTFNSDHRWSFTIHKRKSWCEKSVSLLKLLERFEDEVEIIKLEKLDTGFVYGLPRRDQTLGALAESAIEIILKKRAVDPSDGRQQADAFAAQVMDLEIEARFLQSIKVHQAGDGLAAAQGYQSILAVSPDHVGALNNLSLLVDPAHAIRLLEKALANNPDYVDARINLSARLIQSGRFDDAAACLDRMPEAARADPRVIALRADVRRELGNPADELAALSANWERSANPDLALRQLVELAEQANEPEMGWSFAEQALQSQPQDPWLHIMAGRHALKLGDYERGLAHIEWIWHGRLPQSHLGLLVDPQGRVLPLRGKRVGLVSDSGLGDCLQFIRYARLLHDAGAKVWVECQPELVRLLSMQAWIDTVVVAGQRRPPCDLLIPTHGLMAAFNTRLETIPDQVPYLRCDPGLVAQWAGKLERLDGLKVGVCWAGNASLPRDRQRSIDPELLRPLGGMPGINLVSLQKGAGSSIEGMTDLTADLHDMADTAALVANLDLVIAVDTAVAHLAGALGKPVFLLNRHDACWRWLKDREDSPWYPTLRQFRQGPDADWRPVIDRVRRVLQETLA